MARCVLDTVETHHPGDIHAGQVNGPLGLHWNRVVNFPSTVNTCAVVSTSNDANPQNGPSISPGLL